MTNSNGISGDLTPEQQESKDQMDSYVSGIVGREVASVMTGMMGRMENLISDGIKAQQQATGGAQRPEAPQEPQSPGFNLSGRDQVYKTIMGLIESPGALTELVTSGLEIWKGTRVAMGKGSDLETLQEIQTRNPIIFSHFTPDPFGGQFIKLLTDAMQGGMRVRQAAQGAPAGTPLVEQPSASSPEPSAAGSPPVQNLSDAEVKNAMLGILSELQRRGLNPLE